MTCVGFTSMPDVSLSGFTPCLNDSRLAQKKIDQHFSLLDLGDAPNSIKCVQTFEKLTSQENVSQNSSIVHICSCDTWCIDVRDCFGPVHKRPVSLSYHLGQGISPGPESQEFWWRQEWARLHLPWSKHRGNLIFTTRVRSCFSKEMTHLRFSWSTNTTQPSHQTKELHYVLSRKIGDWVLAGDQKKNCSLRSRMQVSARLHTSLWLTRNLNCSSPPWKVTPKKNKVCSHR